MNVKKAIKRIAALAAGTIMVTGTVMGAMAYGLGDYPMPYVKDGVFNGNLVIGKAADVTDVIGAIDIAASLQAAAKTPVTTSGATSSVSVTGGVQIETNSADVNLGEGLAIKADFDKDDFTEFLADGEVETDDNEYGYEQNIIINPGAAVVALDQDEDYGMDPVFMIDISAEEIQLVLEFDSGDSLPVALDDTTSSSIDMFGQVYTITKDSYDVTADELTLYGTDTTVMVTQGNPVTVEVDGEEYTLEVVGGTTDGAGDNGGTVNLKVTGDGTEVKSLYEGQQKTLSGLDVYIDDILASTIGEESVAATIFVGSNELVIATDGQGDIELNGDDETGIQANAVVAADAIDSITFYFKVSDFENAAVNDDDWSWLVMGETFELPLFGFGLNFAAMSPSVDGREEVEISNSGSTVSLDFVTNAGDDYSLELYDDSDTVLTLPDVDFKYGVDTNATPLDKGNIFILESNEGADTGDVVTYIYEITDIDDADGVTLKDLISGDKDTYEISDEIADTGYTVVMADETDGFEFNDTVNDVSSTLTYVVAKGGLKIEWEAAGAVEADITMTEDDNGDSDRVPATGVLTIDVNCELFNDISLDDVAITVATGTTAQDNEDDVLYGMTDFGTWFEQDIKDDNYVKVYYTETEVIFDVLLNGPNAVVITSTTDAGVAYSVNEFVVGQIAIYDSDAMSLIGDKPLIVVGGPCANTVAMDLMGNPEVCWEGFTEGKAIIKSFDAEQAILVAGYSGEDTTGAARVLADYDNTKYNLVGDEVEVIVTDLENLEVNAVI